MDAPSSEPVAVPAVRLHRSGTDQFGHRSARFAEVAVRSCERQEIEIFHPDDPLGGSHLAQRRTTFVHQLHQTLRGVVSDARCECGDQSRRVRGGSPHAVGVDVEDGHGHVYLRSVPYSWAAILQPEGWTAEKSGKLANPLVSGG